MTGFCTRGTVTHLSSFALVFPQVPVSRANCSYMAGAWVSPHLDADAAERAVWAPGDVLEFNHVYEDGSSQGHSLGLVHASRAGGGFDVNLFWLEASDLREWLTSPGGHGNPGGYTPARSTGTDITKSFGTPPVQPIGVWRRLGRWDQTSFQDVTWIMKRKRGHIDWVFQDAVLAWRRLYPEGGGASDAGARVSHRASSAGSEQVPRSCPASESEGPPAHRRQRRSRSSRRSESTPREPVPKRRRESHVVSSFPPSRRRHLCLWWLEWTALKCPVCRFQASWTPGQWPRRLRHSALS